MANEVPTILSIILRLKDETQAAFQRFQTTLVETKKVTDSLSNKAGSEVPSFVDLVNKAPPIVSAIKSIIDTSEKLKDTLSAAFSTLGGRTTAAIQAELGAVANALETVKASGAGIEEVARAENLATAAAKRLNLELKSEAPKTFAERIAEIGLKLKTANFASAARDASSLVADLLGAVPGLKTFAIGVSSLVGIKVGVQALKELVFGAAQYAAKVETLGVVLQVVARNAGYSADSTDKLTKSIEKQGITTEAARESLSKMIQAGIQVNQLSGIFGNVEGKLTNLTNAAALARAAQDLAVVSGENSSATLSRLVTNIQQMDTTGLRFQGLTVDRAAAESKLAASLGINVSLLTETQKKQAFLNATLSEAAKLSGTYEAALGTVGKQLGSLQRFQDQFTLALGNNFLKAFSVIIVAVTDYLKNGEQLVLSFQKTNDTANDLSKGLSPVVEILKELAIAATAIALDVLVGASKVFGGLGSAVSDVLETVKELSRSVTGLFSSATDGAKDFVTTLDPIAGFFNGLAFIIAAVRDGMSALTGALFLVGSGASSVFAGILSRAATVLKFFSKDLGAALQASADNFSTFSKSLETNAEKVTKKLREGEGALETYAQSFGKSDEKLSAVNAATAAFSKQIEKLSGEQTKGTISATAMATQYDSLSSAIFKAAETGKLSKQQFGDLTKQLTAIPGSLGKAFSEAQEKAGFSLAELRNQISKDVGTSKNLLTELLATAATQNAGIAESAGSTLTQIGEDTINVLTKIKDNAKNVADISVAFEGIRAASQQGIITQVQLGTAVDDTRAKFEQAFTAQLKGLDTKNEYDRLIAQINDVSAASKNGQIGIGLTAERSKLAITQATEAYILNKSKVAETTLEVSKLARETVKFGADNVLSAEKTRNSLVKVFDEFVNGKLKTAETREDFAKLSFDIKALGSNGTASSAQVAQGLEKVKQAAIGAADAAKQLNQNLIDTSRANLTVAQGQLGIATASVAVGKAQVDVAIAQQNVARDNSEINRKALEVAQLQLQVAGDELVTARSRLAEELSARDLLIAKQEVLNAVTALEHDQNNVGLRETLRLAKDRLTLQEQTNAKAQAAVNDQQTKNVQDSIALVQAKGTLDILKTIETQTQANTAASSGFSSALSGSAKVASNFASSFGQFGAAIDTVKGKYEELNSTTANWSSQTIAAYQRTKAILDGILDAQIRLDVALGDRLVSGGSIGSLSGPIQRAEGGAVTGPGTGTSDSVLMLASNGEFVHRTAAVDYYGESFMHRINNMQVPRSEVLHRYAQGGVVGAPAGSPQYNNGDAFGIPEHALSLTFNGRNAGKLRGSRETVGALIEALNEVKKASS